MRELHEAAGTIIGPTSRASLFSYQSKMLIFFWYTESMRFENFLLTFYIDWEVYHTAIRTVEGVETSTGDIYESVNNAVLILPLYLFALIKRVKLQE